MVDTQPLDTSHAAPRRLKSIDILRAVACLAVIFMHIEYNSRTPGLDMRYFLTYPINFGYLGIILFIIISGFCIHLGTMKINNNTIGNVDWVAFWKRRFFRLYPPYVISIAISLVIYYWFANPEVVHPDSRVINLPLDLITHLLMIHNLFIDYHGGLGNGPYWTLGLEEQLYALYALLLVFRRRMPMANTVLLILGVTICWRFGAHWADMQSIRVGKSPYEIGGWGGWPPAYWFFWALGALAAESYTKRCEIPRWCFSLRASIVFAIAGFLLNDHFLGRIAGSNFLAAKSYGENLAFFLRWLSVLSDPLFAVAGFILLNTLARLEIQHKIKGKFVDSLASIGLMSYSLYLLHIPTLHLLTTYLPFGDSLSQTALRYSIYVPICLVSSFIFYYLVERRFLNRSRRLPKQMIS